MFRVHPGLNVIKASYPSCLPRSFSRATGNLRLQRLFSQTPTMQSLHEPLALGTILYGDSGRTFCVEEALLERKIGSTFLCVYLARAEGRDFILKNLVPGEFEYNQDLQKKVASCPNVRTVVDTIRTLEIFIYPFLKEDMLCLSRRNLPEETKKNILRSALRGLADLHDQDIAHNDIKPDNILVDYTENKEELNIQAVQIADLDDAVSLPHGMWLEGTTCGNAIWRSPESWCRSKQSHSSDIFSFGIMMIYVMYDIMVFDLREEQHTNEDLWRPILRRHISYFADEDSLDRFLAHIGQENQFSSGLLDLANSFVPGDLRRPFARWNFVPLELRDLVCRMTNLDPGRRITARQALSHPWFRQDS